MDFILMQTCLKVSFWFSIILAILTSTLGCMVGDYAPFYGLVALFALPGALIKFRLYKAAASVLFFAYLAFAYEDVQAGKRREAAFQALLKEDGGQIHENSQ